MRADGSKVRRLTRKGGSAPVWSPDGKLMLFRPGRDPYQNYLSVMSGNGRSARQLVPAPGHEGWPSDSPDNFDWARRP
jgi:Tol biopolymer transport system component